MRPIKNVILVLTVIAINVPVVDATNATKVSI